MTSPLSALTPLDGRYQSDTAALNTFFSEQALIRERILVEIDWLKTLIPHFSFARQMDITPLSAIAQTAAESATATRVKEIEKTTRHDVKAVEYWLREQLQQRQLNALIPLIHFACTSWDINNIALGKMIIGARDGVLCPQLSAVINMQTQQAQQFADTPMLSRTHGQPASPTTMGKEFANFVARLHPRFERLQKWRPTAKINGAVGNYNAHYVARPDIDWLHLSREFIESQNMQFALHTTQIEPYDNLADLFNLTRGINNILLDFCRDMWGYIALDYFCQIPIANEIGSSTMPHKINPIDFENAEGNIGLANALLSHLSDKLPVSRWQRDLSDSTALRNIGAAFGYCSLAWQSIARGQGRIAINKTKLNADLEDNWQILTEAVQTTLRAENAADDAYEQLKQFARGERIDAQKLHSFINQLPLDDNIKNRLLKLTPRSYCGIAERLAKQLDL